MAIRKISKKEHDKIKHDQTWGIHNCLVFSRKNKYYLCTTTGAPGLKEIATYCRSRNEQERQQQELDLLLNTDSA